MAESGSGVCATINYPVPLTETEQRKIILEISESIW